VALAVGARSIAFPAISTGVYGYPAEAAARIAVRTVMTFDDSNLDEVLLVAFDAATFELYERLLAEGPD
jgi:O-acetyl-ADP-ribose deacetylase (regulator of RNase III)